MKTVNFSYTSETSIIEATRTIDVSVYSDLLVQVYTQSSDKVFIQKIQSEIQNSLGDVKVIGITAFGTILDNNFKVSETIISIALFEKSTVETAIIPSKVSKEVCQKTLENIIKSDTQVIFLFCDAFNKNNSNVLNVFSEYAPEIPLIGGQGIPSQENDVSVVFNEKEIFEEGYVSATINSSKLHVKSSSLLHWKPIGEEMTVTAADGNILKTINHKSVIEIYRYYLGSDVAEDIVDSSREFPLIIKRDENTLARVPMKVLEDNSLVLAGDIKVGDRIRFGFGNLAEIENGVLQSKNYFSKTKTEAIYTFSSISRQRYLKDNFNVELAVLNSIAPSVGFISRGELFTLGNENRILNMTTSFIGLSEEYQEVATDSSDFSNLILPQNRTLKALTHLIDVTTKDLNNSLAKLEQFQKVIEESTIYSITDKKGVIKYANQKFADLSEYTQKELKGKPHNIVRHPDMPSSAFSHMWATIQKGEPWRGVVKNRKKYGGYYYVNAHVFPVFSNEGKIEEYISIRDDITEQEKRRQRLEGQLQDAEKDTKNVKNLLSQYENIIDSNSAIVRFNRDKTVTYVNRGFCEIHGCKNSEGMVGKNIIEIYDKKSFYRASKKIFATIQKKTIWSDVTKNRRPNGEIYYGDTTIFPILDIHGELVEHMIVFHDITDLFNAKKEIEATQRDVISTMGSVGESRSKETGNHVKRVAEYSGVIAKGLGLSFEESKLLKFASPMHDIGKVGIPDSILNKPDRLTEEEFDIMKKHSELGYDMLKGSKRGVLKIAAIVAREHHERYDGKGYPRGLKGEEIHIYGRITALADVFDALSAKRVYKDEWDLDKIVEYIKEEKGGQFDPKVVDVFFNNFDEILKIREKYRD